MRHVFLFVFALVSVGCAHAKLDQPLPHGGSIPGGGSLRVSGLTMAPGSTALDFGRTVSDIMEADGYRQVLYANADLTRASAVAFTQQAVLPFEGRWEDQWGNNKARETATKADEAKKKADRVDRRQDVFLKELVKAGEADKGQEAPDSATPAPAPEAPTAAPLTRREKVQAAKSVAELVTVFSDDKAVTSVLEGYLNKPPAEQAAALPSLKKELLGQ